MPVELIERTSRYIASVQLPNGGIPWFDGGIVDPWDHVEAAMGLTIGGRVAEAEAAAAAAKNEGLRALFQLKNRK